VAGQRPPGVKCTFHAVKRLDAVTSVSLDSAVIWDELRDELGPAHSKH
jgi:hypothetical protein